MLLITESSLQPLIFILNGVFRLEMWLNGSMLAYHVKTMVRLPVPHTKKKTYY